LCWGGLDVTLKGMKAKARPPLVSIQKEA